MPELEDEEHELIPTELAEDYAEVVVDGLIEQAKHFVPMLDHLGSDIPYVKTAIAAIKFPKTLSDVLLGRKVYAFLYASKLDEEKIRKFKEKFSETKQERLWEQVVLSINSHDNKQKSEIVGKLFTTLVDEYISEEDFYTMVHATNTLNLGLLDDLKKLYMLGDEPSLRAGIYYSLATVGLVDINNGAIGTLGGGGPNYPLNQTGWKYVGVVYDFPESSITGLHVGKDQLVSELDENGQPTNKAYPLNYLEQEGKPYSVVDVFLLNGSNQILCEEDTCLPVVFQTAAIPAGFNAQAVASSLIDDDMTDLKQVLVRREEDTKIERHAFTIVGDVQPSHTFWKEFHQVRQELLSIGQYDDHKRYLIAVTEQMERFISGDLSSQSQ